MRRLRSLLMRRREPAYRVVVRGGVAGGYRAGRLYAEVTRLSDDRQTRVYAESRDRLMRKTRRRRLDQLFAQIDLNEAERRWENEPQEFDR